MRLREQYDLREVIPATPKRRRGSRYDLECCPFHEDSNPSFIIYPDWFECKAGCGGGDIVEWVVRTQSVSKERAIEILRSGLPDYVEPPKRIEQPKVTEELPQGLGFKYHLEMGPAERLWYRRRGISGASVDCFQLGFGVPPSGGLARFSIPVSSEGKLINVRFRRDDRCPECGTEETRETDKKEHRFACLYCAHEWVHPDQRGKYIGILNHNAPILFCADSLHTEKRAAFICEGELDCIALIQHGYTAVSGTGGAGVFKQSWARYFVSIPKVYDLHDTDDSGREGARLVSEVIPKSRLIVLPEGKDVGEYLLKHTKEEFEALIAEADRHPNNSPLLRISNGLLRGH